jgi:predicted PurR-regulated permease PerM
MKKSSGDRGQGLRCVSTVLLLIAASWALFIFAGYGLYHFWRLHIAEHLRPVFLWIDRADNETTLAIMVLSLIVVVVIQARTRL